MRTEDGSIIHRCLNGEPEAFGILVDKYKEGIYAFAHTKLRDFRDAQDVTQEVFVRAYRDLRSLRRWESFAFWLYRIASARCKLSVRTQSRRVDQDFIEDQNPETLEAESMSAYRYDRVSESLQESMDSLPDTYREVLMLHYFGGMTIRDIAGAIGISPGAVGMRLSRARAQLKEEMNAMMDTAFEGQRLPAGFTFRIVEAVKRIEIHPMPRMAGLPWGLSLVAGIIVTVLSINPHLSIQSDIAIPTGSLLPAEMRMLETGEIPADVLGSSRIPIISSQLSDGDGDKSESLGRQNASILALHAGAEISSNGIVFFRSGGSGEIWIIGADGGNEKRFAPGQDRLHMAFSPDGSQIAINRWTEAGYKGIFVMNADGSGIRQLTEGAEYDDFPTWSPDGKQIAFQRTVYDEQWKQKGSFICAINADGSNLRVLTEKSPPGFHGDPDWCPDGRRIAFHTWPAPGKVENQIWVMNIDGGDLRRLIQPGKSPDWSPDGERIAFASWAGGPSDIYVMDAGGGNVQILTDEMPSSNELDPVWSTDGTMIAFSSDEHGHWQSPNENWDIYVMDADGSNIRPLTNTPESHEYCVTWTPFPYAIEPAGKLPTKWGEVKSD